MSDLEPDSELERDEGDEPSDSSGSSDSDDPSDNCDHSDPSSHSDSSDSSESSDSSYFEHDEQLGDEIMDDASEDRPQAEAPAVGSKRGAPSGDGLSESYTGAKRQRLLGNTQSSAAAQPPTTTGSGLSREQEKLIWRFFRGKDLTADECGLEPPLLLAAPKFQDKRGELLALLRPRVFNWLVYERRLPLDADSPVEDILAWLLHYDRVDDAARLLAEGRGDPWPAWETCIREWLRGAHWLLEHGKVDPNHAIYIGAGLGLASPIHACLRNASTVLTRMGGMPPRLHPFHQYWRRWEQATPSAWQHAEAADADLPEQDVRDMVDQLLQVAAPMGGGDRSKQRIGLDEARWYAKHLTNRGRSSCVHSARKMLHGSKAVALVATLQLGRLRTLLQFGAKPIPPPRPERGQPDLREHMRYECSPLLLTHTPPAIRLLLEAGVDPNGTPMDEETPIHQLCDHFHIVQMLLDAKADPNACASSGAPILQDALREGRVTARTVQLLLDAGAELCWTDPFGGTMTPINCLMQDSDPWNGVWDLLLRYPVPQEEACRFCAEEDAIDPMRRAAEDQVRGCWSVVVDQVGQEKLRALRRTGHPLWEHGFECALERAEFIADNLRGDEAYFHDFQELHHELQRLTPEGQAQNRQDYLLRFWRPIMEATGFSGVVGSLVFQALVPDFQLRIV